MGWFGVTNRLEHDRFAGLPDIITTSPSSSAATVADLEGPTELSAVIDTIDLDIF